MKDERKELINNLLQSLTELSDSYVESGKSTHYIEVLEDKLYGDIIINGNVAGLIYLARTLIYLASEETIGGHMHLDKTTMLDKCERELIIGYKKAEWDT